MKSGNGKRNLLLAAMMVSLATTMSAAYADTTVSPTISSIKQASIAYINDTSRTPISLYADKGDNTNSVYVNGSTYYFTPDESVKVVVTNLVNTGSSSLYQQETPSYPVFTIPGDQPLYYSYNPITLPESSYSISEGTSQNYNFTTTDGTTTSYYKTNLSTINLLNTTNGSTAWLEGSQENHNFSVVLPNNETRYFKNEYNKPDGWGDGERQTYGQNGNAAGNSADYNNRTFNGIDSTTSGGAIYIDGQYPAGEGHGSNRIGTMTADFINNSITNTDTSEKGLGGALHIWGPYAGIETLNSNFIGNYIKYGTAKSGGGALAIGEGYNGGESTVGLINGNFINNYIKADSYNLGGAIYYEGSSYGSGEITSIGQGMQTTKFVGNHISGSGSGGAIYAVNKIGSIYADFIGNYIEGLSGESKGGAIFLTKTADEKNVGLIVGDFIGNYITTSTNNGTAYGGAIYNNNTVGSITGDFIGNYVVSEQSDTYGGAIYNTGTITTLTSNFIGNYANGGNVRGGAIDNYDGGTITTLNGKFIENIVYSNAQVGYNAVGGAIANRSNSVIQSISGDFIRNKARTSYTSSSRTVSGGAIYNDGSKIGTINANFIENEAHREAGAIYNNGDSSYDKGIGTISGNFIKNKVTGEISSSVNVRGGAISNTGTINSITDASFTNNTVNSANVNQESYGGAIYNDGSITSIAADFTNNKVEQTGSSSYDYYDYQVAGGAIQNYNGSIGTITGSFEGNSALNDQALKGLGGAISNFYASGSTQITNLNADFTSNTAYKGGAISNYSNSWFQSPEITSISGKVAETKAQFNSNTAYKDGGAIYNYSGTIGTLNADFISNKVEGKAADVVYANGGAISNIAYKNTASISNLTGKFDGNYVSSVSGSNTEYGYDAYASGGAIFNKGNSNQNKNANLTGISGSFENNYAYAKTKNTSAKQATAKGGAIYNGGYGVIDALTVNFTGNYAKAETPTSATTNAEGGAIYNDQNGTIGYISGATFGGNEENKGNYAISNSTSGGHAYGGAIYNKGTIGDIEHDIYSISDSRFEGNYVSSPVAAFGGAIYSTSDLYIKNTDFVNNKAIVQYDQNSKGGAIYQDGGTLLLEDSSFTGNIADKGAAIYANNTNVTVYAKTENVEFTNNNSTGAANGSGTGIYLYGGSLTLNAADGKYIALNDALNIVGNTTLNGTLKLGDNAVETLANTTSKFIAQGGTLDIANGAVDTMTFANAVDIQNAINLGLDVNLTGTTATADKITADFTTGNTSAITLSALNFINDNYTGSEEEHNLTIASGTIKSLINETVNPTVTGNTNTYSYSYDQDTGILTVSLVTYDNIYDAVHDTEKATRTYKIKLAEGETITQALGALSGTKLTVNGNNKYLDGDSKGGITVANGQTLELKNISQVKNFTTAVDNAGTLNVEGVIFTSNTTDVNNTATLNLSGNNTIKTITDAATPTGTTNITGGTTTIANGGSITQSKINLKGGHLNLDTATVNANIVADGTGESSGSLRIGDGVTLNGTISGTFKNNPVNNPAIYFRNLSNADIDDLNLNSVNFDSNKDGAIRFISNGDLTLTNNQFTNNERSVNSIIGNDASGAVTFLSSGTNSITGSTFTGNKTKADTALGGNAYGGAIYQQGGTLTISGATFDGNSVEGSSGGSGGAIYSNGTALAITGTTENPTVFKNNGISKYDNNYQGSAYGGAIYQENGTLNISNAKFENNVSDFNIKSNLYGGAIYSEATGGNISADFTGNTLSAVAGSAQGGAIYNLGTLTKITGDFTNNAITLQPTSSSEQYGESIGGAIYNRYMITDGIEGTFSGNTITTNVKQSDANGGALANTGTIGNITGDFLNNSVASTNTTYSGSARGGAIYNLNGTIGNITATGAETNGFVGNSATKAAGYNAEGLGGAIYNHAEGHDAIIGNITADFVNNTATNFGGAIYNYAADNNKAEIGNIIGNFTGNTASQGSAIYNKVKNDESYINNKLAKIGDITGNFTENVGTVIYNEGYYDFNNFNEIVYAQIGDITGNFAENSASSGNVIFNNYGKIGDITGDFTENTTNNGVINNRGSIDSITANTTTHKGFYKNTGGAVRNESSADYHRNATIGNITADFKENSAVSSGGGAIYNTGSNASAKAKIGDITGDFDKNTSKNYGGAIYNNYSIIGAQNNLGEFTGTAIIGDFTYNQVDNNSVYNPIGGAIANENSSSIGNIQGNFENNSIIDSRYKAMGGAIANRTSSTIGNITGNFNANSISYNPIFDTDTFEAQHYGNSSLGGAIYNDSTSTIGTLTGDFVGNWAKGHVAEDDTTTVFAAAGGAIYNEGTLGTITGDIKNNYALGHSHHGVYGGAIYTTTGLNLVDSDITGNYVTTQSASATDLKGGAIYTTDGINITASTKNISVSGNKGTEQGAAIYNTSENNAVVLNATGGNITFENNNLTGLSNGSGVGIYSTGGLTVNSASNKYVSLNDALNIVGNTTLNGTLKLGDNAVETLANTTSKFIAQGGALDIANGAIDTMTFANAVDIQNAINLGLDVNLTGTTATADKITADFTTGNTSAITLSALNFINDNYTGSEEEHELTIASGTIKSLINENITSTTGNTNTYTYSYDQNTGILTVSLVTYDNIYDAVHDTEKATRTYKIKLAEGETITQALGALAGTKLTVNGNNKYLDGDSKGGITVANGQTLELKNISQVKNFTTAVDNAGTLNVENVTFTNNSTADINNTGMANILNSDVAKIVNSSTVNVTDSTIRNIKNTGVLNISDTDGTPVYMLLITDNETPEGITNITGGYTQFVGNVTQNTINLKGGNLTLENNATVNANIVADGTVDKTGYLNINSNGSTINGTISGTFKGNDDIGALSNAGTVGNVTANFVNNTHSGSSDIMGGAIYNTGTMGTISGNFTGNSATSSSGDAKGGAIYQQGGTLTISGATFGGSAAGQGNSATATASGKHGYGGAIYLDSGTMTVSDSAFEKNSATQGGAIYQNSGSITITDSTFKNNTGNAGGAIYQKAGTLSINGSTYDNSGNIWQESGTLSITDSNFTNTDVISRLGSNVTISGSTFDNSSVHFIGKGNETSAINQNTFSIVNSTIENIPDNSFNAYALSVVGGDVTIDGVNIINNTYAKAIKSESAAQGPGDNTHYSKINIIAQAADVNITGNKYGINVIGWGNAPSLHTTLSLYAKDHDILISNNSEYGIYYSDDYGVLTLNADTGHNITINDAVSSTTGMTVNAGGTHAGTIALNGALTLGDVISVGGGTLELGSTAVTSLNKAISTNSGTVKLTGGTLTQAIAGNTTVSGSDVTLGTNGSLVNATVANGAKLTSQASQFTTMNNLGTLLLSGTLDKAISGTGETKINQTLTFAEGENSAKASIAGTLNMNSGTLNMVEEETPAYTNYTVGTLKGSGNLAIDFDGTNTDKLTITTADETPITVTLTALNGFTKGQDAVSAKTILSGASNITLAISSALREAYDETVITPNNYDIDPILSTASWTDEFKNRYYDISTGKQLTVDNSTDNKTLAYVYNVQNIYDSTKDVSQGDTLALVNQKVDTTRTFTTDSATAQYNVSSALGSTGAGKITVQGAKSGDDISTLNMAGNTGFVVGEGAEVELNTVKVTNTANSEGSLINNTAGTVALNNVEIASNSANVIKNENTLNLTGNNTINSGITGTNGTTNVNSGSTVVNSIAQKLINILSGGKLASNGNITTGTGVGEGIVNAQANGLEISGGTLTGNVSGDGSTAVKGAVNIASGSVVSQQINITGDGAKLTANAGSIGGAVSNAVDNGLELTGGELTKTITGDGSTVINTSDSVTIGTGGSISQAVAIQAGTLKTGVAGFTQNITSNAGVVELTGTGTLTQTIAGNTTVSGTDITNNGSLANVTIAGGGVLTSASDKISGTINNGGTLKLSGDLNRTISGSGETIANSDLTIGTNASVTGTLNANDKALVMSGDSLATQTSVGTLKGSGTLSIDVINNSGTIVSDSIKATTYDNSVAFEVNNMTGFADAVNSLTLSTTTGQNVGFDLTVLDGYTGAGLTISDAYLTAYNNVAKAVDRSHTEELRSTVNWTEKFTEESWKDNYNQTLTKNNGVITYNIVKTGETAHQFADGDTLQMLNTTTDFGTDERKFVTTDKNATYDVTADSLGATAAGTMTVKGATDGTTTSTINMANNTGFVVGEGATVNLDTVNITGTKSAVGSLINNTAGEVNLNNVSVATNASDVIANNSTMNLTGSNDINSGITGTGTTNVKSGTSIIDRIAQKVVEIFTGAKLETESIAATNGVTNAGDLKITGTSNTSNITGNGSTEFTNDVNNSGAISQNTVGIANGKTLTTTGNIAINTLNNGGTVTLNSADTTLTIKGGTAETPTAIAGTIDGTGKTVINGVVDNNGTIASAVQIATGSLSTNASNVTGAVTNNATDGLTLTGGTIQNAINGTGSTVIAGTVSNSGDKSIDNAVTIASGSLTTDASQIKQAVTNNVNNGLDLTGGNLASNITGTGSTVISGNVTNNDGKSLGTDMTVSGSLATNADNIGGNITNTGNVQLTGGTLLKDITGGTTQIAGDVANSANIGGTTNITSGSLDNSNGKIANATVGAGTSLTSNADNVSGTVNVTGDYNVTGGAIAGAVTGTGNTNINADTEVKAAVSSNINVADGKTLNVNPTSGNISSAVSVALGDGSKLDISGNTASGDTLNNISIASGKTANLAMDWGDSISTNNIAGNLNVSDIDLTGTTIATPTTYNMATGSNIANVAINENVNLKTNETSFNQVKYNSTTGSFTGAKNNLVQAVTTTEAGESAIYSMSGDEPAGSLGAGVLDGGKLIVQGNGNTISGYGIEVGDGTHNAILTIKDANMKDITGDALLVKGGNTATVMAENSDIEISGATGNAITLNKDANGNSTVNINGGSHTVTIENDIISDDGNNTVNFNSGTVNFNGKFDPAIGVVGGATVNRGGDDDGIDWTVTSGTLNYLQDSYLNRATNTMNMNGGTLNTINGVVTDFALGGFTLSADSNFYADVDLANNKMDNFIGTPTTYTAGTLNVAGLNLISDSTSVNTSIPFANGTLKAHVNYAGGQGLTALSPIYKYNVGYDSSNGNFDFARYNTGGYGDFNPSILAAPVAAQLGGYLTQLNAYDEAFRNMDMYMLMTASQRQALKNKNKIASLDGGVLYDQTLMRQERAEGWFRPYATFEKVGLRNGPKVENVAYGTFMGGESEMYDLGHGWDGMWGAYVGYNGSHQNYNGVSIYQNGGSLGLVGMAYKGNFFQGLTINAGASGVEASTMYGNEDFAMLMAGIASKTGYNWELFNGKFIIQPSMLMSYSFVNTFDYKNAAGVNVDSDPLHAIQLQPELKFIGNLKNGWQPYASVAMVWNIMDNTKFKANDVSLPELSVKPYVKYGVGVRKTWGERLTGFFQTYLTNGGRNGVGLQAGFTWAFGGGKDKKADEQKIQKSLNKTPELKKTEIILNGHKVQ